MVCKCGATVKARLCSRDNPFSACGRAFSSEVGTGSRQETCQTSNLELRFDSIETEKALVHVMRPVHENRRSACGNRPRSSCPRGCYGSRLRDYRCVLDRGQD